MSAVPSWSELAKRWRSNSRIYLMAMRRAANIESWDLVWRAADGFAFCRNWTHIAQREATKEGLS